MSDGDRRAAFSAASGTPYALNEARAASIARDKAFCAEVLRQADVATLPGEMFFITERWSRLRSPGRELVDAIAYMSAASLPVFCKPIDASNGAFAEVVGSVDAFSQYVERCGRDHFAILIQPCVVAEEYRVFVLDGAPLFSYRKRKPFVVGDGRTTFGALVEAAGRGGVARGLGQKGLPFGPSDIPALGERVALDGAANRSLGGGSDAFREGAPDALARIGMRAA
ncbi:MAG: hypothetical protein AB7O98_10635, partial [Hyphomonadaceae bacterium]